MSNTKPFACPRCATPIPSDAPAGLCPACLLKLGAGSGGASIDAPRASERDFPREFGDYQFAHEIARGGMGVVYQARQVSLNRTVAVKVLLAAPFLTPELVERFRIEAQTTARLSHPNIVKVFEAGVQSGFPYLSMEYIGGKSLAEVTAPIDPRAAAAYVLQATRAIEYAHSVGVLHRDIKPSNLLIAAGGTIRVTDFGLAKWIGAESELTLTGQGIGSPNYAAPEQIATGELVAAPAADLYALGAVLYFLTTGRPPFLGNSVASTIQQALENEPAPPRLLNPKIPRDLATICLKCLEKNPAQRYPGAGDLAAELQRFLEGRPIVARPLSPMAKTLRWARREPALAALIAVAVASAVLGSIGVLTQWRRAENANAALRTALLRSKTAAAEERFERGEPRKALALLSEVLRADPAQRVAAARTISALSWRNWPLPSRTVGPANSKIQIARLSPDGEHVAAACADGSIWIWDGVGRALSNGWPRPSKPYTALKFNRDGGEFLGITGDGDLRVGFEKITLRAAGISDAEFRAADSAIVALRTNQTARAWKNGEIQYTVALGTIAALDDRWIATTANSNQVRILDARSGEPVGTFLNLGSGIASLHLSANDGELLVCDQSNAATVWNWKRREHGTPIHLTQPILEARFEVGGSRVALFASGNMTVADKNSGAILFETKERTDPIGGRGGFAIWGLPIVKHDRTFTVLDSAAKSIFEPLQNSWPFETADLSADGHRALVSNYEERAVIWDIADGRARAIDLPHQARAGVIAFAPDGKTLATGSHDKVAQLWNTTTWKARTPPLAQSAGVGAVEFSFDGKLLATGCMDGSVYLWDASTGKGVAGPLTHATGIAWLAFNRDFILASATENGFIQFWDARTGQKRSEPLDVNPKGENPWGNRRLHSLEFSPDGQWLATACYNGEAQIWDVAAAKKIQALPHAAPVTAARFSPNGKSVATAAMDGVARLWDVASGRAQTSEMRSRGAAVSLRFSADGTKLVTSSTEGPIRVWSTATGKLLAETETLPEWSLAADFLPGGDAFGAVVSDGSARFWDSETGAPLTEWIPHLPNRPNRLRFSPNGHWFAAAGFDNRISVAPVESPDGPAPSWLPELAEAVAGERLGPNGMPEPIDPLALIRLRQSIAASSSDDFYSRWARWFLADRNARAPVPPVP